MCVLGLPTKGMFPSDLSFDKLRAGLQDLQHSGSQGILVQLAGSDSQ